MIAPCRISVLTVTFNAIEFIESFLLSLVKVDAQNIDLEIIMVDNGSSDASVSLVREKFPDVIIIENEQNNYAGALNLGIAKSRGDFIAIANNDARVDANWLKGFLPVFDSDEKIGAVQSKILFAEGSKINSVGVEQVEHLYFRDIGFNEEDSEEFSLAAERNYITGGSVMFRRECLDDVGAWDEEFIMFMEDVDYSARCRERGWRLWYSPDSVIYHHYHGSTSEEFCDYFCTRNRFFYIAKHLPLQLPEAIASSHFFKKSEYDHLYRTLLHSMRIMCGCQDTDVVLEVLKALRKCLPGFLGDISANNFFSQLEIILGLRKIRVGIYDHAGHFAGGGQRYVAEMAAIMQDRYDVTYIFNKDVALQDYKEWFDLDLSKCSMKVIGIPFFDERDRFTADEGMVLSEKHNVFDGISRESLNYDIFINANMLGKVNPLSLQSIFVCHFPDQEKSRFFQVNKYDFLMINGDYTGEWVQKRWNLQPTHKLYPPVNMYNPDSTAHNKEKIILSVSRFEISGSKKQLELVQSFTAMCKSHPRQTEGWKLILVGGSTPDNAYLEMVETEALATNYPVEIKPNAAVSDIKDLYRKAAIFWHACGLNETKPERIEHFGMTTVESMQNYCVPIVIDGGGQREIVEQGKSGYRFSTLSQLQEHSLTVITDPQLCQTLAENAYGRSQLFDQNIFKVRLESLLEEVEANLIGIDAL
ncbi:MAG: glycosyltransferase [Halioglobus sp.]|nr:glycosyltransferase [Halioglobus sp.]